MTDPLTTLAILEAQATKGPITLLKEACDCGGSLPCSHADYTYAVRVGELKARYDIADIPEADLELWVAARNALPALLELVRLHKAWVEARKAWDDAFTASPSIAWVTRGEYLKRLNTAESALAAWTGGRA